jgi:hypothetical protein
MIEREVTEFVVVPPYAERHVVEAAKERMKHYLENRFPGYTFRISEFAPVGDEGDFCVVPMMGYIGDDGKSRWCEEPKRWLVSDIVQACSDFDLKGRRHCAA